MAIPGLPFEHAIAPALGKADTVDIPVAGIRADDELLAVIGHEAGVGDPEAFDVSDATVADGKITFGTEDTDGLLLVVIWHRPGAD